MARGCTRLERGRPIAPFFMNVAANPVAIPVLVPEGDPALNGAGGLTYIDVVINVKTGGGGRN